MKSGPSSAPERADFCRVPAYTHHLRVRAAPVRASRNTVRNSALASWRARAHQHGSHQGLHRKVVLEACGRRRGLARARCGLRIRELHVHDVGVRRRCFGPLPATKPITRSDLIPGACVEDLRRRKRCKEWGSREGGAGSIRHANPLALPQRSSFRNPRSQPRSKYNTCERNSRMITDRIFTVEQASSRGIPPPARPQQCR